MSPFDQGNGSGAAVPQVANGAYDIGFGDINALIELAAKKPEDAPVRRLQCSINRPPIHRGREDRQARSIPPADFPGHKLGGSANDGALKLFPGAVRHHQDRLLQGRNRQYATQSARTDVDAGAG